MLSTAHTHKWRFLASQFSSHRLLFSWWILVPFFLNLRLLSFSHRHPFFGRPSLPASNCEVSLQASVYLVSELQQFSLSRLRRPSFCPSLCHCRIVCYLYLFFLEDIYPYATALNTINMDMAKGRFRTPSNGSLHSTCTKYGSHLPSAQVGSRGQNPAQRRPLRSISQNSSLPPSPGLLVSMLKTTTEMGDVRTFPMQQRPVTPTAYHQLPRSRPELVAATPPPNYTPKRSENYYYADDPRPFRSYRDTTSEIISLYAYDNQPSYFGSASPMLDDACHRSYSIATNSSRRLPSSKTSAIMQSHSSGGELQRPRSPFPYPTRLKRPGVRPASPAVADNGCVDYSRMIGLDRVSQVSINAQAYGENDFEF